MLLNPPHVQSDSSLAHSGWDSVFVHQFLQNARSSIPLTIEQIDMMLRVIAAARDEVRTFLVLGCDDSLLASAILDEYPNARGFLVDSSESAVISARRHLRARVHRLRFAQVDLDASDGLDAVGKGVSFDAIIFGSAIQFPTEKSKRSFYRQAYKLLRPEGIFINLEHVTSATRWKESEWDDRIIDVIFGPQIAMSPRRPRVDVARAYYAAVSGDVEVHAPLEVQCDWLGAIGFENVDCFLKMGELAMFGGQRAAGKLVNGES